MENDLDMALCEMTKQRDDLLAALKDALPYISVEDTNEEYENALEAIAKAEGLHK